MSIESPKYFAAGDAGGSPEKNNEQKQAPEKKEIKIDPNNFDEEEIEKIFKDQETTETTKTAKEEKPEELQQTPEQQLKDEVEKFFVEQVQADRHFFSKDITPKEFRTWQEITQTDFKTFSEEKQKILMEMLANELGKNSNLIENAQKDLESKTIDKKEKDEIKKGLKEYLQPLQKAIRARTQVYHLALHPEKPPEKTPEKENLQQQIKDYIDQASVIWNSKSLEPQEQVQRLKEYEQKIKNLIQSDISISWPDLFKMDYNQLKQYSDQISNKVQTTLEANKQIKERIPNQILAKAKEAVEESKSKLPGQSNKDFWLGLLGLLFALLLAGMKKSIGLAGGEESKKESKK